MTNAMGKRAIGVVGAGSMGAGIALVAAKAGHPVVLYDLATGAASDAIARLDRDLAKDVDRGRVDADTRSSIVANLTGALRLEDLARCDLVIEAVVERFDVKQSLFQDLEDVVSQAAILATNTSSLSITSLAAGLRHPGRFVGMHFFNPAHRLPLVEIVSGAQTDPEAADFVFDLARLWGKTPVRCGSTPGFIVNRVARPYYGEALKLLEERAASPELIDAALTESGGFRMGPCALMDLIGHDVNFAVTRSVFDAFFQDPRYSPSLVQEALVAAGHLGRKSGRGFFNYLDGAAIPSAPCEPASPVQPVVVDGASKILLPIIASATEAGRVERGRGACRNGLKVAGVRVALTDGRSAAEVSIALGEPVLLVDLALDYAKGPRILFTASPGVDIRPFTALVQASGKSATYLRDTPGLIVARTVAMLINEAAEVVDQGVASAADADLAMTAGVNYPIGPLAWCDAVGASWVEAVLDNLDSAYRGGRYRTSQYLRRLARSPSSQDKRVTG